VKTVVGSATTEYVFNAGGQRVSEWNGTTRAQLKGKYYWGGRPVAYYTTAASGSAGAHFEHQDWLGTERLRTTYNANGNPTYAVEANSSYTSLPWGDNQTPVANGSDANHYAMLDHDSESNTDHAQFRQYSNTQGRFFSPDPYSGSYDVGNPQSMNRYVYAANSPLGYIDPSGHDCTYDEGGGNIIYVRGNCYSDTDPGVYTDCDGCLMNLPTNAPFDDSLTLNVPMDIWEWAAQQTTPVSGLWTYANWAGSNGMGAPINNADAGAMMHDYCYTHAPGGPYNMWSNLGPPNAALQACNQALCDLESNVAEGINERETANQPVSLPERMEAEASSQMVFYFTHMVRSGNACQ
jgi:RHS repeat-associated protein